MCALVFTALCFAQEISNPKVDGLTKKLDAIIIPVVQFREAYLPEVVEFLGEASKEYDKEKKGVNIVLFDTENSSKITFSLKNVSLRKILKIVGEIAKISVDVEDNIVMLRATKEDKK